MRTVTTARLLIAKALNAPCGQLCVDWATTILLEGREGEYVAMLASVEPPYNHFELADLRDRALAELDIPELPMEQVLATYASQRLQAALEGDSEMADVLDELKDLCISSGYEGSIYDFYLLHWAYVDLQISTEQWYWPNANRKNINALIHERARQFVQEHPSELQNGV